MAIYQTATLSFSANGDGVSTVHSIDFTKQLIAPVGESTFNFVPTNGIVVLVQPVATVALPNQQSETINGTAEVTGTILTVTWASAPPAQTPGTSGTSAVVTLGY